MNLFMKGDIVLSSGFTSDFKIECDALTDDDLECLAYLVSKKIGFRRVIGIGRIYSGGRRFATTLLKYSDPLQPTILIADDVLTTGKSMQDMRYNALMAGTKSEDIKGVVIFAREKCPEWINAIFQMW